MPASSRRPSLGPESPEIVAPPLHRDAGSTPVTIGMGEIPRERQRKSVAPTGATLICDRIGGGYAGVAVQLVPIVVPVGSG
jgi:hypothetical protein